MAHSLFKHSLNRNILLKSIVHELILVQGLFVTGLRDDKTKSNRELLWQFNIAGTSKHIIVFPVSNFYVFYKSFGPQQIRGKMNKKLSSTIVLETLVYTNRKMLLPCFKIH